MNDFLRGIMVGWATSYILMKTLREIYFAFRRRVSEAKPKRFASVSGSASAALGAQRTYEQMAADLCRDAKLKYEAEMNHELLPRAVQLPVSELAAVVKEWESQAIRYRRLGEENKKAGLEKSSREKYAMAYQLDHCADRIEEILAASDTQQRVSSGGS